MDDDKAAPLVDDDDDGNFYKTYSFNVLFLALSDAPVVVLTASGVKSPPSAFSAFLAQNQARASSSPSTPLSTKGKPSKYASPVS